MITASVMKELKEFFSMRTQRLFVKFFLSSYENVTLALFCYQSNLNVNITESWLES